MKTGKQLHGFTVTRVREVPEIKAVLNELTYDKNGARLIWLERDDPNMTFAIGFRTAPQDDTGVFHIIEHSVLCGSEKYPVKDPFVILLKSSLQTFLNAMTFADKTVYPVSSRNRQDFMNLMDVYLDAVLHPLSATDPHAFLQEGWHYEFTEDGKLTRNGVVYNEMKGSFANPDTVLFNFVERELFPDTCYGKVSGGDPAHIPELTYESYLENYRRCYHPSNSYIFLDGSIDTDAVLTKLDSYLCEFEPGTQVEIPIQQPITPPQAVDYYEIEASEAGLDRALLAGAYAYGSFDDVELQCAVDVLCSVLAGTNDAPLMKTLLDRELCEEVEVDNCSSIQQPFASITFRNTSEEKAELCWQTAEQVLRELAEKGLDHAQLLATIDNQEFIQREKDSGSTPVGLILGINMMETWLYGGDPVKMLEFAPVYASLRKKVEEGWFETLLKQLFLENPHCARVMLLPDAELGEKRKAAEEAALAALQASWTEQQCKAVRESFETLRNRQEMPDTPEQLATLPKLSLSDIPETLEHSEAEDYTVDGHRRLHTQINTDGIAYLSLYFRIDDLTQEELSCAEFLTDLLGELTTDHYNPTQLDTALQATFGHFSCDINAYSPNGASQTDAYLSVKLAVLEEKKAQVSPLLSEVFLHSHFDDTKYIYHLLRQEVLATEQHFVSAGHSVAIQHAIAGLTAGGAVGDAIDGFGMLRWLQKAKSTFEQDGERQCEAFAALCRRIFIKERICAATTGKRDDAWVSEVISAFPSGVIGEKAELHPLTGTTDALQIPAQIGFSAKAIDFGEDVSGAAKVASKLLSLDYLWNAVRVKGGAYGTGFAVRISGISFFYSYRDPNPSGALDSFAASGEALRGFCDSGEPIDDYIISSISDLTPLQSPRSEGNRNAEDAMQGRTQADYQRQYMQVLHTTVDDLRAFSTRLDDLQDQGVVALIGGGDVLDACGDLIERREPLQGSPVPV